MSALIFNWTCKLGFPNEIYVLSATSVTIYECFCVGILDVFLLQILDLVPILTHVYFQEKLPVTLSYVQASILLCIGLQNQNFSYIEVLFLLFYVYIVERINVDVVHGLTHTHQKNT